MNNFINNLNRFLKNKNTVTVMGMLVIIAILYFGYNGQIKKQVNPIKNIPVAKITIQPGVKITSEMIDYISVSPIVLKHGNVYMNSALVINKFSDFNTVIPKGSMFYHDAVVDGKELPGSDFVKIKDGDKVFKLKVSTESTFGNAIFPGSKIDIYMKAVNQSEQIMVGRLLENVEVIAVKDSSGKNVFQNSDDSVSPSMLIFGLSPENNILLLKAEYLTNYSVEIFPVPHGGAGVKDGETKVSSQALQDFINAYSVANDELLINQETETPGGNVNE